MATGRSYRYLGRMPPKRETRCGFCRKAGHRAPKCPEKERQRVADLVQTGQCGYCRRSGHLASACAQKTHDLALRFAATTSATLAEPPRKCERCGDFMVGGVTTRLCGECLQPTPARELPPHSRGCQMAVCRAIGHKWPCLALSSPQVGGPCRRSNAHHGLALAHASLI